MSDQENKTKKAVGLSYSPEQGVPKVMLKGSGDAAEQITTLAKGQAKVPVFSDEALADRLYRLPMDSEISKDLFEVVAMLLSHVLVLEQKKGEQYD
ncbi:MAG: EscU/YscU/HrcU family type III secretion system export apparatus switch protein [Pseudomonadota bacterium]